MITGVLRHCTQLEIDPAVRRLPRPVGGRLRLLPPARLPAPTAAQGPRPAEALPPRGRPARTPTPTCSRSSPGHPLGTHPPAVRRAGQVRHGAAPGDGGGRGPPAPLHPHQRPAPHLPGPGRAGQGLQDPLPVRLPALGCGARSTRGSTSSRPGTAPTASSSTAGAAIRHEPARGRGGGHALPPPAPDLPGLHQHADDPAGARRTDAGTIAWRKQISGH